LYFGYAIFKEQGCLNESPKNLDWAFGLESGIAERQKRRNLVITGSAAEEKCNVGHVWTLNQWMIQAHPTHSHPNLQLQIISLIPTHGAAHN
jgi:hypothetical protein